MLQTFNALQPKTSYGHDTISSKIIKQLKFELITPMKIICQRISDERRFPEAWKLAKVLPLHKKGDRSITANYRPISLLPALSKIAEKWIGRQLYNHFERNHLFPKHQYGFRKKKSTMNAVTNLVYEMEKAKINNKSFAVMFMDLSKAFDLIDHTILYRKLTMYGITQASIEIIRSYLSNRRQFVEINSEKSSIKHLPKIGCPQGSILGPLLYLIYTIDVENVTENHTIMYADDTAALIKLPAKEDDRGPIIEETLRKYEKNFFNNKLKINATKTEIISNVPIKININGQEINSNKNTSAKYLGIMLNGGLKWKEQHNVTIKRMKLGIAALSKVKKVKNIKAKKAIAEALINSHLNYGIHLWYQGKNTPETKIIEKLHKTSIRMIAGAKRSTHTQPLCKKLEMLQMKDLYKINVLNHGLHAIKNQDVRLAADFLGQVFITEKKTRNGKQLVPKFRSDTMTRHLKIINEHYGELLVNKKPKTIIQNIKKTAIQNYKFQCDITNCFACKNE